MIDFDDMEEEAAGRAERGELDEMAARALGGAEAPGQFQGGYLWPMKRNVRFPDYDVLPERLKQNVEKSWQGRGTRLRLIIFYGAGDSFPFWAMFMTDCPEWVETAVYEWPRHGTREFEELPQNVDGFVADAMQGLEPTFQQHCKGGTLEGAPFVLMGHSIGVLIMLGVAERARAAYGLEPSCVIAMDRAAPQHPLCSDYGAKLLEEDSFDFIRIFNPQVHGIYLQSIAKDGEMNESSKPWQMCKMWMDDIKFQQNTKPPGFHVFHCPVHVFVAMLNWMYDSKEAVDRMDPATKRWHEERCSILGSKPDSQALWDLKTYEDWQQWTSGGFELHQVDMDHASMKTDKKFAKQLWDIISVYRCNTERPPTCA